MKYILFALAMLVGFSAIAQNTTVNPCNNIPEVTKDMSSTQVATLLETCRTPSGVELPTVSVEQASQWGTVAKEFAGAIGIAAKELGVAVNDFIDSPAGYLMAAIKVFKFAGGVIVAIPFTLVSSVFLYWVLSRIRIKSIEYEYKQVLWGLFEYRRKLRVDTRDQLPEHLQFYSLAAIVLTLVMNIVVWTNLI